MGVYRAALNVPGLRFGKTAPMDDNDPLVIHWVSVGSLVRLDGPSGPPAAKTAPVAGDGDGEVVFEADEKPVSSTLDKSTPPAKPQRQKAKEKPAPVEASSVNPDVFGIKFDDEVD